MRTSGENAAAAGLDSLRHRAIGEFGRSSQDLQQGFDVVHRNHASRRQMAIEAEKLLEDEVKIFDSWWRSLETVSTIRCLWDKAEAIREQELEKALSRLGSDFAEKHQEVVEALTRGIVNKILHDPMVQLRAEQDIEARRRCMQSLQMLFNLDVREAI